MPPEVIGIELGLFYLAVVYTVAHFCEKKRASSIKHPWILGFSWPLILLVFVYGAVTLFISSLISVPYLVAVFIISKIRRQYESF